MYTIRSGDYFNQIASSNLNGWHLRCWKTYQVCKEASDYRSMPYDQEIILLSFEFNNRRLEADYMELCIWLVD